MSDPVNHPAHYTSHPSGVEAIQICQHENFCIGNVLKYLLRHQKKGNPVQDLRKAIWYIECEINRIQPPQQSGNKGTLSGIFQQ
jgi:hypothetical protein